MSKATHTGTCQACGRFQKLPNGVLSKHGYTVQWGFFEGTCPGSHQQPFEISCDLIKDFIASAERQRDAIIADQAALRAPVAAGTTTAWVNDYGTLPHTNGRKTGYVWRQVEIRQEFFTFPDGHKSVSYHFDSLTKAGYAGKVDFYGERVNSIEEVCTKLNSKRADALQKRVNELASYIAWQTERVATWKPGKLKAV